MMIARKDRAQEMRCMLTRARSTVTSRVGAARASVLITDVDIRDQKARTPGPGARTRRQDQEPGQGARTPLCPLHRPSWAQDALEREGDSRGGQSKLLTIRHMALVALRISICCRGCLVVLPGCWFHTLASYLCQSWSFESAGSSGSIVWSSPFRTWCDLADAVSQAEAVDKQSMDKRDRGLAQADLQL